MSDHTPPPELADGDLRVIVEQSNLMALLAALAHATGDLDIVRRGVHPEAVAPHEGSLRFSDKDLPVAREIAFTALKSFMDGQHSQHEVTDDALQELLQYATANSVEAHTDLLRAELALTRGGLDAGDADEEIGRTAGPVAIIGAGMSGLAAAYRLTQAGIPYEVYEKNPKVGGTWFENVYPGARVDANNYIYSYSFAQRRNWPENYSTQPVILRYLDEFAHESGLVENIKFDTIVTSLVFDDTTNSWMVTARGPDGVESSVWYRAVISAVGQLNHLSFPNIPGIETFAGTSVHSGAWDDSVDLEGRRVAVIGTGPTAAQLIPEIATRAGEVSVFQRTPPWLLPIRDYRNAVGDSTQWLVNHVPHYATWHRLVLFSGKVEGMLPYVSVDRNWNPDEYAVSEMNLDFRNYLDNWIREQTEDDAELRNKITPSYPPGGKRMVVDDGTWVRTLKRDNVHLVTDGIERITASGIELRDGSEIQADVIVYATGFTATQFLSGVTVTGREGVSLDAIWNGDARAYLGIFINQLPNFFCLYGPNTNLVVNGSTFFMTEAAVGLIVKALRRLAEYPDSAIEVRPEVSAAYNAKIDAANGERAWGFSSIDSWYKNASGRVSQNWPLTLIDYWNMTRHFDPDEYELVRAKAPSGLHATLATRA